MKLFPLSFALAALLFCTTGAAQSRPDADVLSADEQKAFSERLSQTHSSAERAKIKSEMNRLIQTRKLERRKADKKPQ